MEKILIETLKIYQTLLVEVFQVAQKHIPTAKKDEIKKALLQAKEYLTALEKHVSN